MAASTVDNPIRAFIFDMDDTLASTAPLWRDAEAHLLAQLGATWSPELAATYKGMNAMDVAATIHRQVRPALSWSACQQIMRQRLIDNFMQADIQPVKHACELVQRCAALGLPMMVASGSPDSAIRRTLEALAIHSLFQQTISSEQVARGKPHPDVFLAAAKQLQVPPQTCLVFEDSLIGAQAAAAANMRCVVKPSKAIPALPAFATQIVNDWNQFDPQILAQSLDKGLLMDAHNSGHYPQVQLQKQKEYEFVRGN